MAPAAGHARPTVAVGYDGSEAALLAVRWAAGYAAHAPDETYRLRVIHAWVWPMFTKKLGPVKGVAGSGLRHSAEAILAEGVELARGVANESAAEPNATAVPAIGGIDVEGVMEAGLPAPVLRDAAAGAQLLVVGSRGIGGVLGHLAGSVCLDLAGASPCPLMVIRRPRNPGAAVVVGIDASARSLATLADAARLAGALGTSLHLLHVDQARGGDKEAHGRHTPLHGQELLDHALGEARKITPGLSVSGTLKEGRSASAELLAEASEADVLVLGPHSREGGPGNTVSAVLHKAHCNVLITR